MPLAIMPGQRLRQKRRIADRANSMGQRIAARRTRRSTGELRAAGSPIAPPSRQTTAVSLCRPKAHGQRRAISGALNAAA